MHWMVLTIINSWMIDLPIFVYLIICVPLNRRDGKGFLMANLVTYQEMVTRYERGENALDLTLEKWLRIRESLENASSISHFREILEAAVIKVPLCLENQDNCAGCPLQHICGRGREGSLGKFMWAIKAYCFAGEDLLPKSALLGLAHQIISDLKACKTDSLVRRN